MPPKPEKPLNGYQKFKTQKLVEFKDRNNKMALVNKEWENLSVK